MKIFGSVLVGIRGCPIEFKAEVNQANSGALMLGLAQVVVKEGWGRAKGAIEHSGFAPIGRLGINFDLSPSEIPKNDPTLDLPLAIIALLARAKLPIPEPEEPAEDASEEDVDQYLEDIEFWEARVEEAQQVVERSEKESGSYVLVGNLDPTSGDLRRGTGGVLSRLLSLVDARLPKPVRVIVPRSCSTEVSLLLDKMEAEILMADNLKEVYDICLLGFPGEHVKRVNPARIVESGDELPDLSEIEGLSSAKEAAEVAAAGGHHLLLWGAAGTGKSMLAKAMIGILPKMSQNEFFEVNRIWDATGELREGTLRFQRPIREITSSITQASLLGGGSRFPVPGEISKAHGGILLIDEFNELDKRVLDQLRDPLQKGEYTISRNGFQERFPCRFHLVATMNPCKCSRWGAFACAACDSKLDADWCPKCLSASRVKSECTCKPNAVARYRERISGPIVDRVDLRVRVSISLTESSRRSRRSSTSKKRVQGSQKAQEKRYQNERISRNGSLTMFGVPRILELLGRSGPTKKAKETLADVQMQLSGSKRQEGKIIAVSRTLADLDGSTSIGPHHIEHAVELMGLRDGYWTLNLERNRDESEDSEVQSQISSAVSDYLRRTGGTPEQLGKRAGVPASVIRRALAGQYSVINPPVERMLQEIANKLIGR